MHLPTGLLSSQLTRDELHSKLRERGVFDLNDVILVIVEPTGTISVKHAGPTEEVT